MLKQHAEFFAVLVHLCRIEVGNLLVIDDNATAIGTQQADNVLDGDRFAFPDLPMMKVILFFGMLKQISLRTVVLPNF